MGKTILVTGGTGFLGRHLALLLKKNNKVILTGRNNKQNFLAGNITGCPVMPMDVSSIESVRDCFIETRPDIVIHAAATKFVDLSEKQPMECVDVNVTGSQNVLRVALDRGIDSVIGISTDKAAPPVRNIYGLSKAVMEKMFCSMNGKTATKISCVRYGNVAWSTGSVLPIWKKMHETTGVLGTTGPEMTRFFFTVDEAVGLVNAAIENIDRLQGKILSRSMKSARMSDILNAWVEEKGGRWEKIEPRPGDRLYECLIGEAELPFTTTESISGVQHFVIHPNQQQSNHLQEIFTSDNAERLNKTELKNIILNPPVE